jgi:hypothetical protein
MTSKFHIEAAFPLKQSSPFCVSKRFDKTGYSCYKIDTSPLLLREQGARRPCAASAFNLAVYDDRIASLMRKR